MTQSQSRHNKQRKEQKTSLNKRWSRSIPYGLSIATLGSLALGIILACTNDSNARPNFVYKPAPQAGSIAKIAGEVFDEKSLFGTEGDAAVKYIELRQQLYEAVIDQVKKKMSDQFIALEAQKAGIPTEEFVEKKITKGKITITKADIEAFIKERDWSRDRVTPEFEERIKGFLSEIKKAKMVDDYVANLSKSNPVEIYVDRPEGIAVEPGDSPIWGDKDAPVTIVEFSDFQCPFCKKAAATVDEVKKAFKGKVKLYFRHFPLPGHPEARPAAEASLCVNEQGESKFWKFHDILFKNQRELKAEDLEKHAKAAGANPTKFKECVEQKKFAAKVDEDLAYGEKVGVRATPTFFIDGWIVSGAQPFEKFGEVINDSLDRKKAK